MTEGHETGAGPGPDHDDLRAALHEAAAQHGGYVRALGPAHEAICIPGDGAFVVAFETAARLDLADAGVVPVARHLAEVTGATLICVVSEGETWFRDPALYDFFDELTDEGAFDLADAVLFMGAGSAGYAAAAYSVAAPGAAVLALRPQATLDARTAGWDTRYLRHRILDFEGRYGYAPDMVEAAGAAAVLYDPQEEEDAMHAALFRREGLLRLPCPGLGHEIDEHLGTMGVLGPLARAALDGEMTEALFWRLFRARRRNFSYILALMNRLKDEGRLAMAARVCRHGLDATGRPFFRKRLAALEDRMSQVAAAQ